MRYFSWADVQIPLCFVQGVSYAKRAKTIERRGGYITPRGFEACEISLQVVVSRATCVAYGLNFDEQLNKIRALSASKTNPSGGVTIAGFPIYPELQFALTNCNTTLVADSARGLSAHGCDIILSGVACSKEVTRSRALEFDPASAIPTCAIRCKGKKLILQDGKQISALFTNPTECRLECVIGEDSQNVSRKGFVDDVIKEGGVLVVSLPSGDVNFNIITAALVDNILSVSGSILPEDAFKAVTRSYKNKPLADIVRDLLSLCGVDGAEVKLKGDVEYFKTTGSPWDALSALQDSAGLVFNAVGNKVRVLNYPENIDAGELIDGTIIDDDTREHIARVIWKDGAHEYETGGSEKGECVEIKSAFASSESTFAQNALCFRQYKSTFIAIEGAIDERVKHHSLVKIQKNGVELSCLVDSYEIDWVNGVARYELVYRG